MRGDNAKFSWASGGSADFGAGLQAVLFENAIVGNWHADADDHVAGVKNDLLAIAQAERAYQAEHGSYGSLEELKSAGAMSMLRDGRDGYSYGVETSVSGFQVTAKCMPATNSGCSNWTVDQTMQVQPAP